MIEALIALGVHGVFFYRQHPVELHAQKQGVAHFPLGGTGMDAPAVDGDLQIRGVEALIVDVPQIAAVHGVGIFRPKTRHVKVVGAPAHFLVGGKGNAEFPVRDVSLEQPLRRRHNFRHTGLVVGPQEGGAIGDHQRLALIIGQIGEIRFLHDHRAILVEDDVPSLIFHHPGTHVGAAGRRGCVQVGDKADGRLLLTAGRGGNFPVNIGVLGADVGNPQLL